MLPGPRPPAGSLPEGPDPAGINRRVWLVVGAVIVIAAGLLVARVGRGPVASGLGDALYAALVYLLVALAAPRARTIAVGTTAWGLCAVIELTQLTGVSAVVVDAWGPARYLLGTTFQAVDLATYAVGVVAAAVVVDRAVPTVRRCLLGRRH